MKVWTEKCNNGRLMCDNENRSITVQVLPGWSQSISIWSYIYLMLVNRAHIHTVLSYKSVILLPGRSLERDISGYMVTEHPFIQFKSRILVDVWSVVESCETIEGRTHTVR